MGTAILEAACTLDSLVQWPAVPIQLADDKKEKLTHYVDKVYLRGFLQHNHAL